MYNKLRALLAQTCSALRYATVVFNNWCLCKFASKGDIQVTCVQGYRMALGNRLDLKIHVVKELAQFLVAYTRLRRA